MSPVARINRNIVECKGQILSGSCVSLYVLIETSWNVKIHPQNENYLLPPVLIETSWNVKVFRMPRRHDSVSINRNIVECKVYKRV